MADRAFALRASATLEGWTNFLLFLCVVALLPFSASLDLVDRASACDDTTRTCQSFDASTSGTSLRWRHRSYVKEKGLYGGNHVSSIFDRWFDGPEAGDDWDVLWTVDAQVPTLVKKHFAPRPVGNRLVNHCNYFKAAGQKCYFHGHVGRVRKAIAHDVARTARFPYLRSYVLTHAKQFEQWRVDVRANPEQPWVLKECAAGLSTGIHLLRGEELLKVARATNPPKMWVVAQEYVQTPYMGLGGRKFHLRLYVLVTRWMPPASVFLYDEGLLFRSRHAYDPERVSIDRDVFSAISSDVEGLPHSFFWDELDIVAARPNSSLPGSAAVREHLVDMLRELFGQALEESFGDPSVILPTYGFDCFDFFGLDVMFDGALRPLVLEINSGPNLAIDDRGEEAAPLLRSLKETFLSQMVEWMALRISRSPRTKAAEATIEKQTLRNFSRIL